MGIETLTIANLDFEVRRSTRRKTRQLTVDRAGELVIHAPESANVDELRSWVESKLLWIHRKLLTKETLSGSMMVLDVVSGETIPYLGRNYRLKLVDWQDVPLKFDGQWFCLRKEDSPSAAQLFQEWYVNVGTQWVGKRVRFWTQRVNATPDGLAVGALGFRWGSCGKARILHFNWRLFQLPVRLVDYVIVHEMAHLHEPNHTREFWRILDRVLPDWSERKEELGERTAEMHWCTTGYKRNT